MNGNYCLCIFFFRLKHRFPKFAIAFRIVGACFFGNLWLVARVPRSGASHPCAEKSEQKAHSLAYTAACRCRCRNSNLNRKYVRARIETVCTRFGAGRTQAERQEPETGNRAAPEDPTCEEKINTKVTRCVCGARQKRANDIKNRGAQEKRTHSLFTCAPLFRYWNQITRMKHMEDLLLSLWPEYGRNRKIAKTLFAFIARAIKAWAHKQS